MKTTRDVVRCVCGQEEDNSSSSSVFIQCEMCYCWQHTSCLGISLEEYENQEYTCEECNPVPSHPYWRPFMRRGLASGVGAASSTNTSGGVGVASGQATTASQATTIQATTTTTTTNRKTQSVSGRQTSTLRKRNTLNSRLADQEDALLQQVLMNSILDVGLNHNDIGLNHNDVGLNPSSVLVTTTQATTPTQATTQATTLDERENSPQQPHNATYSITNISSNSAANSQSKTKKSTLATASALSNKPRKKRAKSSNRQSSDIENDYAYSASALATIPPSKNNSPSINNTYNSNSKIEITAVKAEKAGSVKSNTSSTTKYKKIKRFSDMHKRVQQMLDYLLSHSLIPDPSIYTPSSSSSSSLPSKTFSQMHTLADCATALSAIDASRFAPLDEWEKVDVDGEAAGGGVLLEGKGGAGSSDFHVPGLVHAALLRFQSKWEGY